MWLIITPINSTVCTVECGLAVHNTVAWFVDNNIAAVSWCEIDLGFSVCMCIRGLCCFGAQCGYPFMNNTFVVNDLVLVAGAWNSVYSNTVCVLFAPSSAHCSSQQVSCSLSLCLKTDTHRSNWFYWMKPRKCTDFVTNDCSMLYSSV